MGNEPVGPKPSWFPRPPPAHYTRGELPAWAPRAWRLPAEARWRAPEEWDIPAPDEPWGLKWWRGSFAPGGHRMRLRIYRNEHGEVESLHLLWGGPLCGSLGEFSNFLLV